MKYGMHIVRWRFIALFIIGLPAGSVAGRPGIDAIVTVTVTTVAERGPLRIMGFRLPDHVGVPPRLVLRNNANKPIREFSVTVEAGDPHEPDRAPEDISSSSTSIDWPQERKIPSHGFAEAHENVLRPGSLAYLGHTLNSTWVHVVPMVARVEFEDGTIWTLRSRNAKLWRNSIAAETMRTSESSAAVKRMLSQWDGRTGYASPGSQSRLSQETRHSYSVACPLLVVNDALTALCGW